MTQTAEKKVRRVRPARRGIYYCQVVFDWKSLPGSFEEKQIKREIQIVDPEIREGVEYTLDRFLKKKLEPTFRRGTPRSAASIHLAQEVTQYKEGKELKYRSNEIPLTKAYVMSAKYYLTDEDGWEETEDGAVKPWVHIVFNDGSQVDVPFVKKRGR